MNQSNPKILLTSNTINTSDYQALSDWLKTQPRLSKGMLTLEFEKQWAEKVGTQYAIFVNSGSSANLIILYSLICSGKLKNKKILCPAVAWPTTISPIIQFNLEPILVDCDMDNLSVDLNHLETTIKKNRPAALILVSVLGLVPDMDDIVSICRENDVVLILDGCESLGSQFKFKNLDTFALASSCSLFYSHQACTIEGGMITTNDKEIYDLCIMLRSHAWSRDLDENKKKELQTEWDVSDFESLYKFYEPGFNVRATDLQAFIGLRQLQKLDSFVEARNRIYHLYNDLVQNDYWKAKNYPDRYVSCLGYPVISLQRDKIVNELIANGVECRPLIAGSMGNQPFFIKRYGRIRLPNADIVDKYGFYVPCHPFLSDEDVKFVAGIINKHSTYRI